MSWEPALIVVLQSWRIIIAINVLRGFNPGRSCSPPHPTPHPRDAVREALDGYLSREKMHQRVEEGSTRLASWLHLKREHTFVCQR